MKSCLKRDMPKNKAFMGDMSKNKMFKRHSKSKDKKPTADNFKPSNEVLKSCTRADAPAKCKAIRFVKPLQQVQKLPSIFSHSRKDDEHNASPTLTPLNCDSWSSLCKRHDEDYFSTQTPPHTTTASTLTHSKTTFASVPPVTSSPGSPAFAPVAFSSTLPDASASSPQSLTPLITTALLTPQSSTIPIEDPYWGRLRDIDEDAIANVIIRLLRDTSSSGCYNVVDKKEGSFHVVYIASSEAGQKVCLKIPAYGQEGKWLPEDAVLLRSEALSMRFIKENTQVPLPTMFAYDATMDNEIGAPFILMSFIDGRPANELSAEWILSASPGDRVHKERVLNESLVRSMAGLSQLRFGKIGMLDFPEEHRDPVVTTYCSYCTTEDDDGTYRQTWTSCGPFKSSKEYFLHRFNALKALKWQGESRTADLAGVYKLLEVCAACVPASGTPDHEAFGLAHSDLNLQNVLCDDDGNVVGIIYWEKVHTAPVYLGWASLPLWLREDWELDYNWPYRDAISSPVQLETSRTHYATALREQMGKPDDWLVPEKSLFLTALDEAMKDVTNARVRCPPLMTRMLPMILPTVLPMRFLFDLAEDEEEDDGGWIKDVDLDLQDYVTNAITQLFRCVPEQAG